MRTTALDILAEAAGRITWKPIYYLALSPELGSASQCFEQLLVEKEAGVINYDDVDKVVSACEVISSCVQEFIRDLQVLV
ncbi:hypothetical protein RRG08_008551 [Elysia crispata]|uniref:Uncharacterized protein n=1 Tax=Elysia crispata TaxID=231223 RepID=A0AAE0YMG8_9GAST|nr:hypothetical protein RRG08_008551 [Elysia crispata]